MSQPKEIAAASLNFVRRSQIDALVAALDGYTFHCAIRGKHFKGRWAEVVRCYADVTGMTKAEADEHLRNTIPTGI